MDGGFNGEGGVCSFILGGQEVRSTGVIEPAVEVAERSPELAWLVAELTLVALLLLLNVATSAESWYIESFF